jgi:hypothetical protein
MSTTISGVTSISSGSGFCFCSSRSSFLTDFGASVSVACDVAAARSCFAGVELV